jgi:hypothetical protein
MGSKMTDDEKYQTLMAKYKDVRRDPEKQEESMRLLKAAFAVKAKGGVDPDIILGMSYL